MTADELQFVYFLWGLFVGIHAGIFGYFLIKDLFKSKDET